MLVVGVVRMRRRRSDDPIVDLFANKIDSKSDESDAESWGGLTQIARQQWMLSPPISSPEELACVPHPFTYFVNTR